MEKKAALYQDKLSLLEPKEEPLDDFSLRADENEIANQPELFLMEPKEEPLEGDVFPVENQISQQYFMDETDCKKEEPIDDKEPSNNRTPSSHPVKDEPVDEYIQDLVRLGLIPDRHAALDQSAIYDTYPEVAEESKDVKYEADYGDEKDLSDSEPATKKRRSNHVVKNEDMVQSDEDENDEVDSQPVRKKLAHMKNDAKLECPECKLSTKFVGIWIRHLRVKHSSSLLKAGLVLRCQCGDESQSEKHIRECNSTNECVVRVERMERNTAELECPECEFRTRSVYSWLDHLGGEHCTNPILAGLALLCECGKESTTINHSKRCDISNFTVIRKRDGPIRRLEEAICEEEDLVEEDSDATPQCFLCEAYPLTVHSYANHVRVKHRTNLSTNGIYLKCSCGDIVRTPFLDSNRHSEKCDGCEFTLHKVDKKDPKGNIHNQGSVQCVLCDKCPTTAYTYANHIHHTHKSSLIANGIFLRCSCGIEYRSCNNRSKHSAECNGLEFTLQKLEAPAKKVSKSPKCAPIQGPIKCIMCEKYPPTAQNYVNHLRTMHDTTLSANKIFLRCSCGVDIRSSYRHCTECDGRIFTLHELETKVYATPQCVLCQANPSSVYAYADHLNIVHESTLNTNGILLLCSCGTEVRCDNHDPNHIKECDGCEFTLHMLDNGAHSSPQCILCKTHPTTVYSYADHLKTKHKSSLLMQGLYLLCACGKEIRSHHRHSDHSTECDRRSYTLHKLNEK